MARFNFLCKKIETGRSIVNIIPMSSTSTDLITCGLTIPCVSVKHIIHDLEDCIVSSDLKVAKRVARLRAVLTMQGINPDAYMSLLNIANERSMIVEDSTVLDFIDSESDPSVSRVVFNNDDKLDDTVKKVIESELTSKINRDLAIYKVTCNLMRRIWKRIERHSIFAPLCKDKRILLVHKGGIAQRLALLKAFPQHYDLINANFKLGGDNDVNIFIDPQLEDYDRVRNLLVDYVHHTMIDFVSVLSCGTILTRAKEVTSIHVGGLDLPVENCDRNHFAIRPDGEVSYMDIDVVRNGVFTSFNDSLKFKDDIGRTSHFTLLRYKKAFRVGKRVFGAELLDIAIPHKDESKAGPEAFRKYRNGMWLTTIDI